MKYWLAILALICHLASAAPLAEDRTVAFTFDDLPFAAVPSQDDAYLTGMTQRLLDGVRQAGAPAVGFVNEKKLYREGQLDTARVDMLRDWLKAGFDLGNHAYSHISLNQVPLQVFENDLLRGETVTRPLVREEGHTLHWFRHPYLHIGKTNAEIEEFQRFLTAHDYAIAPVTINDSEWVFADAYAKAQEAGDAALAQRIGAAYIPYMNGVFAWAEKLTDDLFGHPIPQVLLLHANSLNADHFGQLAAMLKQRGYRFVSLAEALKDPAYSTPLQVTGLAGESWLERWSREAGLRPLPPPPVPGFVIQQAGRGAMAMDRGY
jgi:peptidoglycan/xylan/chitin deacetylase (PgdA/CDA1 family)